ncbi:MAG TPA: energy transducer TonB [Geothrix sp.]|nr:energy transducer TonB [Geothrix sp.]
MWVTSAAVYGGLLAAGMAMAVATPRQARPTRTVTLSLETFDAPLAPPMPPPAFKDQGAPASRIVQAHPEEVAPVRTDEASHPASDEPVPPLPTHAASGPSGTGAGAAGGAAGGVSGGQAGGLIGGLIGGSAESVAPPRFDAAYLQNPEPGYPALSRRFGEEGRVILRVLVNPEGQPEQVEVRQSSGHARLDQAALGTVRRWRFTPARRGSERLAAWVLVPLSFQLDA